MNPLLHKYVYYTTIYVTDTYLLGLLAHDRKLEVYYIYTQISELLNNYELWVCKHFHSELLLSHTRVSLNTISSHFPAEDFCFTLAL